MLSWSIADYTIAPIACYYHIMITCIGVFMRGSGATFVCSCIKIRQRAFSTCCRCAACGSTAGVVSCLCCSAALALAGMGMLFAVIGRRPSAPLMVFAKCADCSAAAVACFRHIVLRIGFGDLFIRYRGRTFVFIWVFIINFANTTVLLSIARCFIIIVMRYTVIMWTIAACSAVCFSVTRVSPVTPIVLISIIIK